MKRKGEQGAIMIEATWCVLLVMFVFFFMISFGFLLYQRVTVQIVANEVAEEIAQTYKLKKIQDSSSVTEHSVGSVGKYRFLLYEDSFESANERKAELTASSRLMQTSLASKEGEMSVSVEKTTDDVGRYHLKVTVSQRYGFLLGGFLKFIGQEEKQTLKATAYVVGTDFSHYANTIHMAQSLKVIVELDALSVIDKAISLLNNLAGLTK